MTIDNIKTTVKYSNEEIVTATRKVAERLNEKFKDINGAVTFLIVLDGALPFAAELMKHINFDMKFDFIRSSSYVKTEKVSSPKINYSSLVNNEGKHVVIIDDMIDSGETLSKIGKIIEANKPASITLAIMFAKETRIKQSYEEVVAFDDKTTGFLVGFGLDYNKMYRNLPYILELET
ncbi:MAG: hypoxanthine phosphoribosyltransferase [Tenericutes bacterium]|nr:MAG: hypoxanthine phosphoribosyltransferase [Mycoplasmatota bacterium]